MDQNAFKPRWPIAALLLTTAFASGSVAAQGSVRGLEASASGDIEVFVQLNTPSVAEFNAAELNAGRAMPDGTTQRAYAARISAEQEQFRSQLSAQGAVELSTQRVGANGFRVLVSKDRIDALRQLPGVRTVGRVETHTLDNVTSVPWIGSQTFWATYGLTGENVSIGVIDTGIDYTHANFGGPGTVAAYTSNNKNIIEAGTFPTAKVVGGRDFAGPTYNANVAGSTPQPDDDPLDGNGHGSHVAGTAAGLGVPGSVGSGVAPGAKLYALKVFGDAGGSTNVTSLAIEWAMDPNGDGDMSDHLDVINMSLGSPLGEPADPSAISTDNASAVGIIVATSAGNEGDTPYVTGAPGVAGSAISTAAATPGGRKYSRMNVTAPAAVAGFKNNLEGSGPVSFEQTGPISGPVVRATPDNGCAALTNAAAVSGNIALIARGVCGFVDKYLAAQNAGARAIVVYNDGTTPARIDPIVMGGLDPRVTIPGLMISSTDGFALRTVAGLQATLDSAFNPTFDDQIATFSSRGPGHGGSTFKPDVTAPGVAIVSTGVGTGTGSLNLQGTSMASPHVAGAAALLHQKFPTLPPKVIKAMLQNSSVSTNASGDTDVARQGTGAIRVDAAGNLTSYAIPGGLSFGRINVVDSVSRSEAVRLTNLANTNRTFTVQHIAGQTYPGVTVTCPTSLNVGKYGSRNFNINLKFDPSVALGQNVFDNGSVSQTEVDGWCVLSDGIDTLRVAYIAVVDPASRNEVTDIQNQTAMRVRNTGPGLGIVEGFTLNNYGVAKEKPWSPRSVGFRAGNPDFYFGDPVLELAIETRSPIEHISNLVYQIFLDTDKDGDDDVRLIAADLSAFQDVDPGIFVTGANFTGGPIQLDWEVLAWDFNDQVAILPFTRVGGFNGKVPDSFNYRIVITGRDETTATLTGSIDFANEVTVDLNSFALDPGTSADVNVLSGNAPFMWVSPNDVPAAQADVIGKKVHP